MDFRGRSLQNLYTHVKAHLALLSLIRKIEKVRYAPCGSSVNALTQGHGQKLNSMAFRAKLSAEQVLELLEEGSCNNDWENSDEDSTIY